MRECSLIKARVYIRKEIGRMAVGQRSFQRVVRFSAEAFRQQHLLSGIILAELARRMGIANGVIVGWQNGSLTPDHEQIVELARVLECEPAKLLATESRRRGSPKLRVFRPRHLLQVARRAISALAKTRH